MKERRNDSQSFGLMVTLAVLLVGVDVRGQSVNVKSSEAGSFLGTWVFAMTNPLRAQETVRIVDKERVIAASVQAGRFPPINVSGILKDGDMLVLIVTRFENGKPVRSVISLVPEGETMKMA